MATTQPSISPGLLNAGPVISTSAVPAAPPAQTKRTKADLHQLHALPVPIQTFPLPVFYPSNPLSLVHLAYAWLNHVLFTPKEPATIHQGIWSPQAGAVLVKDAVSIRALWEQGFYGKGHLSRSEPEWFRQEQVKRGLLQAHVSHLNTAKRREERRTKKWERAKSEIDALRQLQSKEAELQRAKEATEAIAEPIFVLPPVGPLELLALPNTLPSPQEQAPPKVEKAATGGPSVNGSVHLNGSLGDVDAPVEPTSPPQTPQRQTVKRQKSVRFSPEVQSTTVDLSLPPSPELAALNGNGHTTPPGLPTPPKESPLQELDKDESAIESQQQQVAAVLGDLVDKEHLQLTREEAFFLSFGLGALQVVDGESKEPVAPRDLLELFRRYSYIPPQQGPPSEVLRPDDRFLLDYVIYHHFRSLGWVPRGGIKFGVDWLLYFKGPAFDHAQYGIIIMPSYSHPYWKERGQHSPSKDWAWFHRVSRTLANVLKTIVLAYVDIPPPPVFEEALDKGITDVMQLYTVREIIAKRFNPNRERKS